METPQDAAEAAARLLQEGRERIAAGKPEAAIGPLLRCIGLAPGTVEPLLDLALAMHRCGEMHDAIRLYRTVLARAPGEAHALNGLGAALARSGDHAGAVAALRQALAVKPGFPEAELNLGRLLRAEGRLGEATALFSAALAARPEFAEAQWNRALVRLLAGDLPGAWPDFEARWALPGVVPPAIPRPRWAGEPLAGRTILLTPEQGLGDTIQFARYAPVLAGQGARVLLGVQSPLKGLLTGLADAVIAEGEVLPPFDCHLPLLSVPGVLRNGLGDLPCAVPYLQASPEAVARWQAMLGGEGLRVGLVWSGNPAHPNDANRSMPLAALAPLLEVAGARFFALQMGAAREAHPLVTDLADRLTDFTETAAALSALDLLVSVDTAALHLAGALGRPAWALLPQDPDWRWLLGRSDSPWYPSLRLFRQAAPRDWSAPVASAVEALRALVAEHHPRLAEAA